MIKRASLHKYTKQQRYIPRTFQVRKRLMNATLPNFHAYSFSKMPVIIVLFYTIFGYTYELSD